MQGWGLNPESCAWQPSLLSLKNNPSYTQNETVKRSEGQCLPITMPLRPTWANETLSQKNKKQKQDLRFHNYWGGKMGLKVQPRTEVGKCPYLHKLLSFLLTRPTPALADVVLIMGKGLAWRSHNKASTQLQH